VTWQMATTQHCLSSLQFFTPTISPVGVAIRSLPSIAREARRQD
jgi:hypothetical protein